ncbi:WG repeat-containing protein [Alistipes putredinis]|uniref:WG repeat-containing protein n=1 Tax=Alistipes putredinis TaxID=28117 RepID=UPI003AF434A7
MLHSIRQFIEALQDPYGLTRTLGEIEVCRSSDGEPLRWVGNSAVVFKIRCGGRYKMLKCYTRPMEHLEAIYQEKLLRQELYVWQADGQGEWCDVVIDDWIEGITLYEAVMRGAGSGDKAHLSNLARQFDRYNRGEGLLLSPRKIVRHGCAAHAECLALFEKAGDAVRYRIARLLESPLMRLPNLKPLVRYAVCGPETPADRGELFVRDGLWGFKIGERELIPPIYDAGFDFTEGLAAVRTGRCWHFIDPTGAVAIDCSDCNAVKPFANGRAIVVRDGQRLAIGRKEPRTTLHI